MKNLDCKVLSCIEEKEENLGMSFCDLLMNFIFQVRVKPHDM